MQKKYLLLILVLSAAFSSSCIYFGKSASIRFKNELPYTISYAYIQSDLRKDTLTWSETVASGGYSSEKEAFGRATYILYAYNCHSSSENYSIEVSEPAPEINTFETTASGLNTFVITEDIFNYNTK